MELYRVEARRAPYGWAISCPAFGIAVDAGPDQFDKAMGALRRLMAEEADRRLSAGGFLPKDAEPDMSCGGEDLILMYVETDFNNRFVRRTSETVRRNVSMPAWMDLRLRRNGVDASRLFQDAAVRKLDELERTQGSLPGIRDLGDLERACPEGLLDDYFKRRMAQVMDHGMNTRGRN